MATLKQIEANRLNALKSTGPKTLEGKSAVRLNSLKHGLRAATLILPGENQEEFDQLCAGLEAEWRPQSLTASFYLERMAIAQWKLRRLEVAEANLLSGSLPAAVQIPLLDRLWQSQIRLEKSFTRAQRELERIQGPLPTQPAVAAPVRVSLSPPIASPEPDPSANWVCSAASVTPAAASSS